MAEEKIIGLAELRRAANRIDREMNKALTRVLKAEVAAPVVTMARIMAPSGPSHGKVRAGALRRSIKASVRGGRVSVVSSPALNPSPGEPRGYARVIEYGHGGVRAFLRPAVRRFRDSGELERAADHVLDWIEREWPR